MLEFLMCVNDLYPRRKSESKNNGLCDVTQSCVFGHVISSEAKMTYTHILQLLSHKH